MVLVCPKDNTPMVPFTPKGFDGSTGGYSHCNSCGLTTENYKCKNITKDTPLGRVGGSVLVNDSQYTVIESRRTKGHSNRKNSIGQRRILNRTKQVYQPEEIPKFPNGKEDTDLEFLLKDRAGIILNIQDDNPGDEVETSDKYE